MADFRKWILALAVLALFTGFANAQVGGGNGGGTTPFTCTANAAVPPQLRNEGFTELTGDIVVQCTGGPTYALGAQIPQANFTVFMNGTVTSRLLASSGGASEALLMIDDPGSTTLSASVPGFGPQAPQNVCTTPSVGCVEYVGLNNNNANVNVPSPVAGTANVPAPQQAPNVFQGIVSGSSVTWYGVPVLPPSTSGVTRIFRITNIRVNANGITGGGPIPANAVAAISISGATSVPISNPQLTVGFINQSLSTSVRITNNTSTFGYAGGQTGSLTKPIQCANPTGSNGSIFGQATLRFAELFGTAFKDRTLPTTSSPSGATNPGGAGTGQNGTGIVQNVPGSIYNTESGFIQTSVTTNTSQAGLADWGTRVKAVFNNIPNGISVYVTTTNIFGLAASTAAYPPTSPSANATTFAVLITGETAPENGNTAPTLTPTVTATSSSNTTGVALYQLPIVNGSATAVWEIVGTVPTQLENVDVGVALAYTASPGTGSPAPGTMTVNMSYAPTPSQGAFTASSGAAASNSLGIPRFADTSTASNVATVSICTTSILFPFVTNTNGFDTGLAIANTSTDPFGTAPQAGTCSLNWYGNATASSNPPASALGGGGVGTATPIASGTVVTALASTTVPGFQGYMIAVCNFQFGHGFAFVSDLGARNLAMGYLGLIMNAGGIAARPTGIAEILEN